MQRNFFDDFTRQINNEYKPVSKPGDNPSSIAYKAVLEAAALRCRVLKKMSKDLLNCKKSLSEKLKNTERIMGVIAAYEAYMALVEYLMSEQFYNETIKLYRLDLSDKYSFDAKIRIYQRLNKHLDLIKPLLDNFELMMQSLDNIPHNLITELFARIQKVDAKLDAECTAIDAAQTKATRCMSLGVGILALCGLGLVAEATLSLLVLASVITVAAAFPWLAVCGVLGIIFAAGVIGDGLKLFELELPVRFYDLGAVEKIKTINENFFNLFAPKSQPLSEMDGQPASKPLLSL